MVVYLSMGLLSLILGTIMCRLVVMGLTWMVLGRGFWILPNVLSEVSGAMRKGCKCIGRSTRRSTPPAYDLLLAALQLATAARVVLHLSAASWVTVSSQYLLHTLMFDGKLQVMLGLMAAICMRAGARLL